VITNDLSTVADDNQEILKVLVGLLRPSYTILAQVEDGGTAFRPFIRFTHSWPF
jgi:hypothetical protein